MQFSPQTAARLAELYRLLRRHFDYVHPWWPGTPFQISITAVLVQQCAWSVAWEAVQRLDAEGIQTVPQLAEATAEELYDPIRKVAFAPTKSARLIAIARHILTKGFDSFEEFLSPDRPTLELRNEVLSLPGIGQETSDCLLNFASAHPVFVVDAYTRRIFDRLNIISHLPADFWTKATYAQVQRFFETHLLTDMSFYEEFAYPADLLREVAILRDYHALLVELGKHHCLKTNPHCRRAGKSGWPAYEYCLSHCLPDECPGCPLAGLCRFPMEEIRKIQNSKSDCVFTTEKLSGNV